MEGTDGRPSPRDMVYNVPFLTGEAGTVPINQLPMNQPPAELRGGEGRREMPSVCNASVAAKCWLQSLMFPTWLEATCLGSPESEAAGEACATSSTVLNQEPSVDRGALCPV